MGSIQFGEFDAHKEEWIAYTERLEEYFQANEIKQGRHRAVLLSVCGAATYQLIRNLLAPTKPSSKTYKQLVKLVQDHINPRPSIIVERFSFHTRRQREGESINDFVADLRKCSEHCKFGNTLDDMLRDRLVCGVRNTQLQRRLLAEQDLTFQKALSTCQASEAAERDTKSIQAAGQTQGTDCKVLAVNQKRTSSMQPCYRCGGKHSPRQ
jgi:hypothetical protein